MRGRTRADTSQHIGRYARARKRTNRKSRPLVSAFMQLTAGAATLMGTATAEGVQL